MKHRILQILMTSALVGVCGLAAGCTYADHEFGGYGENSTKPKIKADIPIDVLSTKPITYFESIEKTASQEELLKLFEALKFETAEQAYGRQVKKLAREGCSFVSHYLGPVKILSEAPRYKSPQHFCLIPSENGDGRCDFWGETLTNPPLVTLLCPMEYEIAEILPEGYSSADEKKVPAICILKARALVAHAECISE